MCDCDSNYCVTFNQRTPKARKPHRCCECRRTIQKGETYENLSGLWRDTGFDSFKICQHCTAARKACEQFDPDACICFEGLAEYLWDNHDDIAYHVHKSKREGSTTQWLDVFRLYRGVANGWTYKRGPRKGQLKPIWRFYDPKSPAEEVARNTN